MKLRWDGHQLSVVTRASNQCVKWLRFKSHINIIILLVKLINMPARFFMKTVNYLVWRCKEVFEENLVCQRFKVISRLLKIDMHNSVIKSKFWWFQYEKLNCFKNLVGGKSFDNCNPAGVKLVLR